MAEDSPRVAVSAIVYLLNRRLQTETALTKLKVILTQANKITAREILEILKKVQIVSTELLNLLFNLLAEKIPWKIDLARLLNYFTKETPSAPWQNFLPTARADLKNPLREVRLLALQILHKTDGLTQADTLIALGDAFEKIRTLARGSALIKKYFTLAELQSLRAQTKNVFLWESLVLLEVQVSGASREQIVT
jgi:hypothetical protein